MNQAYKLFCILLLTSFSASAQQIIPYSYRQYQKLNRSLYSRDTRLHTSIRPVIGDDSTITAQLEELLKIPQLRKLNHGDTIGQALGQDLQAGHKRWAIPAEPKTWLGRKLFSEHLLEVHEPGFSFYLDYLTDLQIGRDTDHGITTTLNTRGYQFGGSIGKKISFYSSGFENAARFNDYLTRYIGEKGVIPGMTLDNKQELAVPPIKKDWSYATAVINYTPNKHFSFTLGQDKNFIGDGYRSMLLSDAAAPYPFLKGLFTLGNVKYMAMWAQLLDPLSPKLSYSNGYRKKWGAFHYLDWNVNNRLSLGFFDAVIWQGADSTGRRGFDVSYLNPIVFLRTTEGMNGSPDNALLGLTAKYKLLSNLTVYGQLAADEFTAKEVLKGKGYWSNKFAYQLGIKGFDAFKIAGLNYLAEFNTARPFTYSQRSSLLNYGHYAEALAHPMGANFREFLSIWNYELNRWNFSLQGNFATYGLNRNGENMGKDINLSYDTRLHDEGYKTAGGLKTNFYYADARVAFVINPKYNLRLELGGIMRTEKNALYTDRTHQITFGLRSTFRNIYQDF